jgi:dTMP kinase
MAIIGTKRLFITFEGCDGSGKTYQSRALYRRLTRQGIASVITQEPGGTPLGNKIRSILKQFSRSTISAEAELFFFNACRVQLINEVIKPNLLQGVVVICDRFADSTIVYQGYGRGIELEKVRAVNEIALQGIRPDLTVLLDIPVEVGLNRKHLNVRDRFESEGLSFHNRVREGFLQLASEEPERWLVIDGLMSKKDIFNTIWSKVNDILL